MTLEQLRIFVAVAEREHVTRAAEAIHRTQSAVSAAIAGLEHQSGVTLFHRVGRRIALTEEGRQFLDEARAVIAQADAAERALADLAGMKRGTLTLMASQTIASYWLPPKLVQYRALHPNVAIKAMIGNTAEVADAVRLGRVEIGLVEGAVEDPVLELTQVGRDRLMIVAPPGHPWTRRPPRAADLLKESWVLREPGSGTRSAFEAALKEKGVDAAGGSGRRRRLGPVGAGGRSGNPVRRTGTGEIRAAGTGLPYAASSRALSEPERACFFGTDQVSVIRQRAFALPESARHAAASRTPQDHTHRLAQGRGAGRQ
jgi:DNA-binding transcriptional LysR family regulator